MGRTVDHEPARLADLVLALTAGGIGETIFIEPARDDSEAREDHPKGAGSPGSSLAYAIVIERGHLAAAVIPIESGVAAATIARLAFIADVDLATNHAVSGVVRTRAGGAIEPVEVVVTVRPGAELRADIAAVRHARASRPAMSQIAALDPATMGPHPGQVIGSYKVIERLGEGGMGTVFRVQHIVLGQQRALKVLRAKLLARDATSADRFVREARAAARIVHGNIVSVFDFGHLHDGRPYFVMELLPGESLFQLLADGPLAPSDAVAVARQLASALAAAHDAGVVHADVTPANVFITSKAPFTAKLLDFGLAELVGDGARASDDHATDFVLGTPSYISPEQLRGLAATHQSDQYSLGAVIFEMLAGTPPFVDSDLRELCMKHITAPIPDVLSKFGPLPPALGDAVVTCLQKSPQARFPTMRALVTALDEVERVTDRSGWRRFLTT